MLRATLASFALALAACAAPAVRVMSFNVLQGAADAPDVGFDDARFPGGRCAAVANAILAADADVVGVQEDAAGGALLEALGPGWSRAGAVYARCPVELLAQEQGLSVVRVTPRRGVTFVLVDVHWRPSPYGPFLLREALARAAESGVEPSATLVDDVLEACAKPDGPRGWGRTLDTVRPLLDAGERVVVVGDFNEPSALDWRARLTVSVLPKDQPPGEFCSTPSLLFGPSHLSVPWRGSRLLADLGLRDAYRLARPSVDEHPGWTWTPPYEDGAPGRRPWSEQVLDRIDWILVGPGVRVSDAWLVGEHGSCAELPVVDDWPSDHRAVLAELRL